jgi:hypothetical protein
MQFHMKHVRTLIFPTALLLAGLASATETSAVLHLGGSGSVSSEGFNDPALLADGVTPATATLTFEFDDVTGILVLTVDNTSPVFVGVANPVMTQIDFNAPMEVSGMSLITQTSAANATPAFSLTFDPNLNANPNPNTAAGFGRFNVELDMNGTAGAIANPDADTYGPAALSLAIGPVVFTIQTSGVLAGVTAEDFTSNFSVNPPGTYSVNGAAHFQAGGPDSTSAYISDGEPTECYVVMGFRNEGDAFMVGGLEPHLFPVQVSGVTAHVGVSLISELALPLPAVPATPGFGARRIAGGTAGPQARQRMFFQAVMWNPPQFPWNPEQRSTVVEVVIFSDGSVATATHGTGTGLDLGAEIVTLPDGRRLLRLPFGIQGL